MDWAKAKNILIVAFIITNLFLLFNISKDLFIKEDLQLINDHYIENVEVLLNDNGIQLKTEIPREIISLPLLDFKYENLHNNEIIRSFLGTSYEVNNNIYTANEKQLSFESNKRLKFKKLSNEVVTYAINEKEAITLSEEFLKSKGLLKDDLSLTQVYFGTINDYDTAPLYKLVYNQTYRNRFLGESYAHVYVNHRGVIGLEAMLLKHEKTQTHRKKTIPASEALLKKMNDIVNDNENQEIVITSIEMGYYLNPYDIQLSDWKDIESGTAVPTWKITLENGKIYYAEALKN